MKNKHSKSPKNTKIPSPAPQTKQAVALLYTGEGAPKVTAKGKGILAEQILKLAEEHHIPISEEHELVALLAQVELEQEIPEALYQAVAQVLAFAYALNDKPFPTPPKPHS